MKKFLALVLALCMVFALCACGSSAPAATEAPAAEAPAGVTEEMVAFYEAAFKATMEAPDYLAAASSFATDFMDAATTAALIQQQQEFTEGLSENFWFE